MYFFKYIRKQGLKYLAGITYDKNIEWKSITRLIESVFEYMLANTSRMIWLIILKRANLIIYTHTHYTQL